MHSKFVDVALQHMLTKQLNCNHPFTITYTEIRGVACFNFVIVSTEEGIPASFLLALKVASLTGSKPVTSLSL